MIVAITFCILEARILNISLYSTIQQAIGMIVVGFAFLGTNVIEVQLQALKIFPMLKNSLTAAITSSLMIYHVFLKKCMH